MKKKISENVLMEMEENRDFNKYVNNIIEDIEREIPGCEIILKLDNPYSDTTFVTLVKSRFTTAGEGLEIKNKLFSIVKDYNKTPEDYKMYARVKQNRTSL